QRWEVYWSRRPSGSRRRYAPVLPQKLLRRRRRSRRRPPPHSACRSDLVRVASKLRLGGDQLLAVLGDRPLLRFVQVVDVARLNAQKLADLRRTAKQIVGETLIGFFGLIVGHDRTSPQSVLPH